MDKIFGVELSNGKGQSCKLELPASNYELLDALDRLRLASGESPDWKITGHTGFEYLHEYLDGECSLYELNELSRRLGSMDRGQIAAFEGLFYMALQKREGPMSVADLLTYANSTDCCHVVGEARNDSQLGRFYAENGFIPDIEAVPDSIFELLDFEQLGRKARVAEGGIFTKCGYVVQHDALRPVTEPVDIAPQVPDYAFRLLIDRYPFEDNDEPENQVRLELPATEERIAQALEECGAPSWEEVTYEMEDSAIPGWKDGPECDDIAQFNELAVIVKHLEAVGELPKLKAVLHATHCDDANTAIAVAEDLDAYIYEPDKRTARDVALEDLHCTVSEPTLSLLLPHVYLEDYGLDLLASEDAAMTPYGLVASRDGSMLLAPEDKPPQGGMQMQ